MKRVTRLIPLVVVATLAMAMLVPAQAFAKAALGVSSGSSRVVVDPGTLVKGNLDVLNPGDEPLNVLVYAADQKVSATGTVTYVMPTKDSPDFGRTPASWVQIALPQNAGSIGNIPFVSIAPGGRVPLSYSFTVPQNAQPGDYQILIFFEMTNSAAKTAGASSSILGRVGSRIVVRVNGTLAQKLDVAPFSVKSPIFSGELPYALQILNTGNTDAKSTVVISVVDSNDAEKAKETVLDNRVVYAGTTRAISGSLKLGSLGFGTYKVKLKLTAPKEGSGELITVEKERTVTVIPMWMVYGAGILVLLLVVLVIALMVRTMRRRSRSAAPAAVPAAEVEEPLKAAE